MIYYARLAKVNKRLSVRKRQIREDSLGQGIESKIEKELFYIDIHAKSKDILERLIKEYRPQLADSVKFTHIRHSEPKTIVSATAVLTPMRDVLKSIVANLKATGTLP